MYKELVLKLRTEAAVTRNQNLMDEHLTRMDPEAPDYVESRAKGEASNMPDTFVSPEVIVINEPDHVESNVPAAFP